jgi:hypothetical protein
MEKRRLEILEKDSKILHVKTLELQQNRGGVNAVKESDRAIHKQIRVLENRLDKALVKFNEALAFNKQLREEIDNLRRERVVFDQINAKLAKELHEKKKEMAQIIEISNIAYEARDQVRIRNKSCSLSEAIPFKNDMYLCLTWLRTSRHKMKWPS